VRFDEPGTYTITVISHRVRHATKNGHPSPEDGFDLKSNGLEIHIIRASPQWQRATLDRIQRDLAVPRELEAEIVATAARCD
jgi:hypothetical protein